MLTQRNKCYELHNYIAESVASENNHYHITESHSKLNGDRKSLDLFNDK